MDKLHHPGDHRNFMPNRVIGPDTYGAWYRPISAHYFNGVTTIFYRPVPPDELPPALRQMSAKVAALQHVWKDWKIWHGRATAPSAGPRWSNSLGAYLISQQSGIPQASSTGSLSRKSHRELRRRFKKHH